MHEALEADETGTPDVALAASTPPVTVKLITWPQGALGSGLISDLAQTLGTGETVQLVLTRVKDILLVTVQHQPIASESVHTAIPLQAQSTPAALDTHMVTQLREYREGRSVAREAVGYAAQVKAAAETARKASASAVKKPATTPASTVKVGGLHLEISPKDAVIVLIGEKGRTHPASVNTNLPLAPGTYTVAVDADGYTHVEETVTVKASQTPEKGIVLQKAGLF